jgi:BlaI family penicillinase repressor
VTNAFVIIAGMAKTSPYRPTKLELAILGVLWQDGPGTVRDVLARLNKTQEAGYTTVLKMLQIMTDKELVVRDETTRPQMYRARFSRQRTQRQLLKDLMERAFGGSVRELVMQALSTRKSSPEDLEAMEKLLDRFEGGSK